MSGGKVGATRPAGSPRLVHTSRRVRADPEDSSTNPQAKSNPYMVRPALQEKFRLGAYEELGFFIASPLSWV